MAGAYAPAIRFFRRRLRTPRGTHRPLLPLGPGGVKQVSAVPRRRRYYSVAVGLCQVRYLPCSYSRSLSLFSVENLVGAVGVVDWWKEQVSSLSKAQIACETTVERPTHVSHESGRRLRHEPTFTRLSPMIFAGLSTIGSGYPQTDASYPHFYVDALSRALSRATVCPFCLRRPRSQGS